MHPCRPSREGTLRTNALTPPVFVVLGEAGAAPGSIDEIVAAIQQEGRPSHERLVHLTWLGPANAAMVEASGTSAGDILLELGELTVTRGLGSFLRPDD